ncbi:Toll/interleukin-1 receptor domain-containing protein, partial [Tanacetum coccineum]
MECQKMTEHTAYPVFYDVEPTEVPKPYGPFQYLRLKGHEANFIQKIIQEISLELRCINSSIDENLVGMETRVYEVISSLETGTDDVHMIGIKGMGGAGKTTLARAVFDKISFQFEDVLNDPGINVSGVHEGKKLIHKKMHVRKVLIVLDDVDKIEQLEALVGDRNWFKPGSRIIITTRDEQVLIAHKVCLIQNVNLLSTEEAICLFSRYAFGKEVPSSGYLFGKEVPVPGYEELSRLVVCYAAGLPLTIRILGSFLCEEDYKEIFSDVACLLKGWLKDDAIRALESCGFYARNGLRVLEQRSLITISENGYLVMHDHIEEMGKNIVRRLNPNEPKRHSRLWIQEEIEEIMAYDWGTQATKCITMFQEESNLKILMKGFAKMKELRFLLVRSRYVGQRDEVILHLPNALRFLKWDWYPFSNLPKTFQAKNLVGLEMEGINMVQLWKDGEEKPFLKLRFLKFTYSWLRTLDLSVAPNLETLILESCNNLVELHFQVTPNLKELRLTYCDRLEKLHMPPDSPKLRSLNLEVHFQVTPNLKELYIYDCDRLEILHMPAESPKLTSLNLDNLKLRTLHLGITPNLENLSLDSCSYMVELQIPSECPKLVNLKL